MRIDSTMASDYLTTIGASAGIERPIKVTDISIETTAAPGAAGPVTITDGSSSANVIYERQLPATANLNVQDDFGMALQWRNFKCTAIPTNTVVWIRRR